MQIDKDQLIVLTPAIFDNLDPIWMLTYTASKFSVPLRPYGCEKGAIYRGWVDVKVHRLIEQCKKAQADGYSHILYMDGRDTMWVGPFENVVAHYNLYGAPPLLMSSQPFVFEAYREYYDLSLYPTREQMGHPYHLPGSPLFMGQAKYIQECLEWMLKEWDGGKDMPDDDPAWWRRFDHEQPEEISSGRIRFDYACRIFLNAGEQVDGKSQWSDLLAIVPPDLRVLNKATGGWPCVLHFDGGYSHALYGKWDRLERFWKAFGHGEVRPPWER